jgi:hypothetical protein
MTRPLPDAVSNGHAAWTSRPQIRIKNDEVPRWP